jgi:hypothetical protein
MWLGRDAGAAGAHHHSKKKRNGDAKNTHGCLHGKR